MKIWRLISHHQDDIRNDVLKWYLKNKLIAIGWGRVGNLKEICPTSSSQIGQLISSAYPELENRPSGGPSLWHFYKNIKKGDLVVLVGEDKKIVVKIEDDEYHFNQDGIDLDNDYKHQRIISLVNLTREQIQLLSNSRHVKGDNPRWPLFQFNIPIYHKFLMDLLS